MSWLALAIHLLFVIPITLRILLRDDISAPARLAWFMVVFLFPYLGVIIYLLFGEVHLGREIQIKKEAVIKFVKSQNNHYLKIPSDLTEFIPEGDLPLAHYAASVNGFSITTNNRIRLMADDTETINRMVEDIDQAKHHVHVLYYIWLDDNTGQRIAKALIAAAKRGVICRVMVDGLGSRAFIKTPLWSEMSQAGIRTQVALSLKHLIRTAFFSRIDLRNHRKITIIDNQITYCGSQNCADKEFRVKPKYAPWVDIMYRVTGSAVTQNQLLFASDWLYYHPEDSLNDLLTPATNTETGSAIAQIVGFGPTSRSGASSQLLTTLISNTSRELIITTPYFVPDMEILSSLAGASYRGVNITLIVPARNDSWIVSAASHSHYRRLLEAGIKIYEYNPGLLHAKTLTVDGEIAFVGSTNLDLRSFDLNYENNIIFYDREATKATVDRQKSYLDDSTVITLEQVRQWSIPRRLWNNAIATIGPIL